jgi:signal transduction histidine kinase
MNSSEADAPRPAPAGAHADRSLENLLVSIMDAREEEGARVSRILHDEVGQVLSAIGLQLDLLRMDLQENPASGGRRIAEIQKVLERAVGQVRELSYELNPAIVERTGLQSALDRLVGRQRKNFGGTIRLFFDSSVRPAVTTATAMYKIAEQALDNAVRHARATHIEVLVKPGKHGVTLEVRDDGTGFDPQRQAAEKKGIGLPLMRYHADQAGLRFSVNRLPEKGTIVRAVCPAPKVSAWPAEAAGGGLPSGQD